MSIQRIETFTKGQVCLVRVTTGSGEEGWGQAAPYHADITANVLHQMVAPHALGRDAQQTAAFAHDAILENYKFIGSFVCRAVSGIETAMWDLLGKREQRSVCELLGGSPRDVPVYASSMRRDITPEDEVERFRKLCDQHGFKAFKIKIGKENSGNVDAWPGRTEALIDAVARAFPQAMLIADANGCYDVDHAVAMGKLLADRGYRQFEEPCMFLEVDQTAAVTRALRGVIEVSGGEQDFIAQTWRRIIDLPAVDIIQPDVCYIGGVSRLMQVAAWAAERGLACTPHAANRSMLQIFTMHTLCAIPNAGPFMECSIESNAWAHDLFTPAIEVVDGAVPFPTGPGWGVTPNPQWLAAAEHRVSERG